MLIYGKYISWNRQQQQLAEKCLLQSRGQTEIPNKHKWIVQSSLSLSLSSSLIELCILAQCEEYSLDYFTYLFYFSFSFSFRFGNAWFANAPLASASHLRRVFPSSSSSKSSGFSSLCCKNCVVYITKVFYNLFSLRLHFLFVFSCFLFWLFIHLKFDFYLTCWQAKGIRMANEWPAPLRSAWLSSPLNSQKEIWIRIGIKIRNGITIYPSSCSSSINCQMGLGKKLLLQLCAH